MQTKIPLFGRCLDILPPVSVNATKPQNPGSVFSYTALQAKLLNVQDVRNICFKSNFALEKLDPKVTQLNPGYKCWVLHMRNHCKWSTVRPVEMVSTMNLTIAATAAFFLISGKLSQTFMELMFSYSVKLSREKRWCPCLKAEIFYHKIFLKLLKLLLFFHLNHKYTVIQQPVKLVKFCITALHSSVVGKVSELVGEIK